MRTKNKYYSGVVRLLSSRYTIWVIVGLFIVQALWVALLFRFPLLYDEQFHFNVIKAFSHFLSPIIVNQSTQYDNLGNLTFGNASIYHFLLSFPYKVVAMLTDNQAIQVIAMRLINVFLAATAIPIFAKFFKELGIKTATVNVGLFIYVCIPIVTTVAATVNYDNLVLPLTALFLLFGSRIVRQPKQQQWTTYAALFSVGIAASLVKFTFLPIFAVATVFLGVIVYRERKTAYINIKRSFLKSSKLTIAVWIIIITVLVGLAGFRYGVSLVLYHTPIPSCKQTMPLKRCLANPVTGYEESVRAGKSGRQTVPPGSYIQNWEMLMVNGFALTSVNTPTGIGAHRSPGIYREMLALGLLTSIFILLYAWRSLRKNQGWYFALITLLSLTLATLVFNIISYYQFNQDVNVQSRYILSVLPVLLVFAIAGFSMILGNRLHLKICLLVLLVIVTTQGGGVVTHIVESKSDWYWSKPVIQEFSSDVRNTILPVILFKD